MPTHKQHRHPMRCSITIEIALPAECLPAGDQPGGNAAGETSCFRTEPTPPYLRHEQRQESLAAILKDVLTTYIGGVSKQLAQAEPARIHLRLAEAPPLSQSKDQTQRAVFMHTTSAFANGEIYARKRVRKSLAEDLANKLASFADRAPPRKAVSNQLPNASPAHRIKIAKCSGRPASAWASETTAPAATTPPPSCDTPLPLRLRPAARARLRRRATEAKANQCMRAPTWRLTRRIPR